MSLLESLMADCRRMLVILGVLRAKNPLPPVVPPPVATNKIEMWALAIQKQEGGRLQDLNTRLHNPGNLKLTPYTESLGGKPGPQASDGGFFCRFDSYTEGFNALCQFLRDACNGKLKSYKPDMSLLQFTKIYAQPPNSNYANGVAEALGVPVNIPIKMLL